MRTGTCWNPALTFVWPGGSWRTKECLSWLWHWDTLLELSFWFLFLWSFWNLLSWVNGELFVWLCSVRWGNTLKSFLFQSLSWSQKLRVAQCCLLNCYFSGPSVQIQPEAGSRCYICMFYICKVVFLLQLWLLLCHSSTNWRVGEVGVNTCTYSSLPGLCPHLSLVPVTLVTWLYLDCRSWPLDLLKQLTNIPRLFGLRCPVAPSQLLTLKRKQHHGDLCVCVYVHVHERQMFIWPGGWRNITF